MPAKQQKEQATTLSLPEGADTLAGSSDTVWELPGKCTALTNKNERDSTYNIGRVLLKALRERSLDIKVLGHCMLTSNPLLLLLLLLSLSRC